MDRPAGSKQGSLIFFKIFSKSKNSNLSLVKKILIPK